MRICICHVCANIYVVVVDEWHAPLLMLIPTSSAVSPEMLMQAKGRRTWISSASHQGVGHAPGLVLFDYHVPEPSNRCVDLASA